MAQIQEVRTVMRLAVTATRRGLTAHQLRFAGEFISSSSPEYLIHGAARGGDTDLHNLAHELGVSVIIYPADDVPSNLKYLDLKEYDILEKPYPALFRNRLIVDSSPKLLAFPALHREELRSGTWAAVRYARKQKKEIFIVWPDGTSTTE